MRIIFAVAIAIGITVGFSIPAARAEWRHHHHYAWQMIFATRSCKQICTISVQKL